MSQEAKGRNNQVLGTKEYFKRLNEANKIAALMNDSGKYDYYNTMRLLYEKIQHCLGEISSDLDSNAKSLPFINSDKRKKAVNFVKSLESVCQIIGMSCNKASDCTYMLDLNDSRTALKTNTSISKLEDACRIVINGGKTPVSSYERKDILEKAVKSGMSWATGGEGRKMSYLVEILSGHREPFLIDVWNMLCYHNNGAKGKCGYEICSDSYLQYHEKEIFGSGLSIYNKSGYENQIKSCFKGIVHDIEKDVDDSKSANNYIKTKNAANIIDALKQLRECKADIPSDLQDNIMELDWYVSLDKEKVRQIQQGLNGYLGTKKLLEDGVYGEKTEKALKSFVDNANEDIVAFFENGNAVKLASILINSQACFNCFNILGPKPQITSLYNFMLIGKIPLQRAIWNIGIKCLRKFGYNVSAECLKNSLDSGSDLYFSGNGDDSTGIIKAIKDSEEFNDAVSGFMSGEKREEAEISGQTYEISLEFYDTKDLYYSLGKVSFSAEIQKSDSEENLWHMSCNINDTYDFSELRTYRLIVDNDKIKGQLNLSIGNLANDMGLLSQMDGVLKNYKIEINFDINVCYDYSDQKYKIIQK